MLSTESGIKSGLFFVMVFLLINIVGAAFVGTVPGSMELNELERGEEYELEFYVTTDLEEDFFLEPEYRTPFTNSLFRSNERAEMISQQDKSEWIDFNRETFEIDPSNTTVVEVGNTSREVEGQISFTLDIPSDAEPGIHYGRISTNPQISTGDGDGAGSINVGQSDFGFNFELEGSPSRALVVDSITGFRRAEDSAVLRKGIRNEGSVTIETSRYDLKVLDSEGESVGNLTRTGVRVPPGQNKRIDLDWRSDSRIEGGTYHVEGEVDYLTGSAIADSTFTMPDFDVIEIEDGETSQDVEESQTLPLWLVLMVLSVLGVLMWSFEIDPVWILSTVGFMMISSLIIFSGISNLLILAPIAIFILFYTII